ncbi:MAG: RHS repeat-associated core domain-containing protein [Prevotella sp.]|nr:RHS repeat-associated core domain-containing protein [Prevotella sp.]
MNHAGQITQIRRQLGSGEAVSDYTYDAYGNITKTTLPANAKGQRMWYTYRYEPVMNMYVEHVEDAFGYQSEAGNFDYRYGIALQRRDLNNFYYETDIDNLGRVKAVRGPNELATGVPYIIAFDYQPKATFGKNGITAPAYAVTRHYDIRHPSDDLETVTLVDGFGRPVQVKKDGVITTADKGNTLKDETVMIVSGRNVYDAFGRVAKAYYPMTEALGSKTAFNKAFDNVSPTVTVYDVLDRAMKVTLPDNTETRTEYTTDAGRSFCCDDGRKGASGMRAATDNFHEADAYQRLQFYYHSDHLGNSTYITNLDAEVTQHIEYVPFGEVFIEELEPWRKSATEGKANSNNTWNTPYLFNAKEFDEETGLYYYRARYYDPRLSLWMSTDPLEEKYPNISSYDYCMNNPVKFIDPDGKELKLAGNRQQRIKILTYLQKLTNDKLGVRQDGTVIIMKTGVRNTNKKLTTGTELISNIVKSDKQMTIEIGKIGSTNYETDVNSTNATNGKGTNVKVNFDISANPLIPTKDPKTGNVSDQNRPNEIGLAHEMIHGERSMKGKAIDYSIKSSYTYKDVNGKKTSQMVPQEELETVGLKGNNTHNENNIRKEQGLKQRGGHTDEYEKYNMFNIFYFIRYWMSETKST